MISISVARLAIVAAVAIPLWADDSLIQLLAGKPDYYPTGNYGSAYVATTSAGRMALDSAGNLYFLDGTSLVRKLTPDGRILPVAGYSRSATLVPPGERTQALLERLDRTDALALDGRGNLFVAGYDGRFKIFRVASDGLIENYVGRPSGHFTKALAADAAGNLYVLEGGFSEGGSQVLKILPDRTIVPLAGTGIAGYGATTGPLFPRKSMRRISR